MSRSRTIGSAFGGFLREIHPQLDEVFFGLG